MRKFLIITHGGFAKGVGHTLSLFLGEDHPFDVISAYMDDTPVQQQIDKYMLNIKDEDELVILTDIMGGSVNQRMMPYITRPHTFIIAGFNFPLLMELSLFTEDKLSEKQLYQLVEKCKDTMILVNSADIQAMVQEDDE